MAFGSRMVGYLKQLLAEVIGSLPLQEEGLRDARKADREGKAKAGEPVGKPGLPGDDR
jgi:hypothetical protein